MSGQDQVVRLRDGRRKSLEAGEIHLHNLPVNILSSLRASHWGYLGLATKLGELEVTGKRQKMDEQREEG